MFQQAIPDEHVLGQYIPLHYHYNMLLDQARMSSFRDAIQYLTPSGAKVLDLGGGTGVLSHFAASKAGHVWCVERNPELVRTARRLMQHNPFGHRVEVIQADAMEYLPPEPVDVVICEMLHTGLMREKQIQVIGSFQERYLAHFGGPLPRFVPEASLLAVQPVEQPFEFSGFSAPIPFFQDSGGNHEQTRGLCQPLVYAAVEYDRALPERFEGRTKFSMERSGQLNALRFITKNLLAFQESEGSAIEWSNQYLVVPLGQTFDVAAGAEIVVEFSYGAGCQLEELLDSAQVIPHSQWGAIPADRHTATERRAA